MILAIINILLVLFIKIVYDYKQWLKKRNISSDKSITNHSLEWILMVIGTSWAIYKLSTYMDSHWVIALGVTGAMVAFFIWNMFDGIYNKLRGYGWWFTGSNDKDDAKSDDFLQALSPFMQKVVKVGGFLLFIILYIIL